MKKYLTNISYFVKAYQIKRKVETLSATHDWYTEGNPSTHIKGSLEDADRDKYPLVHHPVIRTHPETNEKAIFTNNFFTSHIDGVEKEESQYLLRKLADAIRDPSIQIRVRWDETTVVMWDNPVSYTHLTLPTICSL